MSTTPYKRWGRGGFTLAELLVSVLLLTVGVGGAMVAFSQANGMISAARGERMALHEARHQMERLRTLSWTDAELAAGNYSLFQSSHTGRIVITDVDAYSKKVTVRVNYRTTLNTKKKKVVLTSLLARALHE